MQFTPEAPPIDPFSVADATLVGVIILLVIAIALIAYDELRQ